MSFQETPEGQTHSFNDRCGESEHNGVDTDNVTTGDRILIDIQEDVLKGGFYMSAHEYSPWYEWIRGFNILPDGTVKKITHWTVFKEWLRSKKE